MKRLLIPFQNFIRLINADVSFEDETKQFFVMIRIHTLLMYLYFLIFCLIAGSIVEPSVIMLFIPWFLLYFVCLLTTYKFRKRIVFHIYSAATLSWIVHFVVTMGWDCGVQHFMFPLLLLSFFATYDNLLSKATYTFMVFCLRIILYLYTHTHAPLVAMPDTINIALQFLNTSTLFISMFIICWSFSHTTQETQAKLSHYNERLKHDASTDALTGLPNRRSMYDSLRDYMIPGSDSFLTIAMGDIDFFKQVNDTKGHECGDAVLKRLAEYMQEFMQDKGLVCRWGGEEFFFLFPDTNGDLAASYIYELNKNIAKLPITYNDETFYVTMTFGVEEYNFVSSSAELIKLADDKLYRGKALGRNRVIF